MVLRLSLSARKTAGIFYTVAAAGCSLWLLLRAFGALPELLHHFPYDGWVDWIGARAFFRGINPYIPENLSSAGLQPYGFGHPPTTPFWFLPFASLSLAAMSALLAQMTIVLLLLHVLVVVSALRLPALWSTGLLIFSVVMNESWMRDHFSVAQVSELIAFFYVAAWYALRSNVGAVGEKEQEWIAGAFLGLACTIKLFPGIMVGFLVATKRWRAVAAACLSYLIVAAVMTWRFGFGSWKAFFSMQRGTADHWAANVRNGSIFGVTLRLFWPSCREAGPTRLAATALAVIVSAAMLGLAWRLSRNRASSAATVDAPFALFSVISYFVNPWAWEHYDVFLIFPFAVVAADLLRGGRWSPGKTGAVAAMAAALAMLHINMNRKVSFAAWVHENPKLHLRLHLFEVANWLPSVIAIGLLAIVVRKDDQRARIASAVTLAGRNRVAVR